MEWLSSLGRIFPTGWLFVLFGLVAIIYWRFLVWWKRSYYPPVALRAVASFLTLVVLVVWIGLLFTGYSPTAGETVLGLVVAAALLLLTIYAVWPSP